jgi:hypothetical protein
VGVRLASQGTFFSGSFIRENPTPKPGAIAKVEVTFFSLPNSKESFGADKGTSPFRSDELFAVNCLGFEETGFAETGSTEIRFPEIGFWGGWYINRHPLPRLKKPVLVAVFG